MFESQTYEERAQVAENKLLEIKRLLTLNQGSPKFYTDVEVILKIYEVINGEPDPILPNEFNVGNRVKTRTLRGSWSFREAVIIRKSLTRNEWVVKYQGDKETELHSFPPSDLLLLGD